MFLPNEGLVHLVFVNEKDIYYCDSGLQLKLPQYLWLELHNRGYRAVYFLNSKRGGSVENMGDDGAGSYDPSNNFKSSLFGSPRKTDALSRWMLTRLTADEKDAAAIVCPIDVFCGLFEDEVNRNALRSIAESRERSGIIVLTANANIEKVSEQLLTSPVFGYLKETAVLNLSKVHTSNIYKTLYADKGGSCLFLNAFTKTVARDIIFNALLENTEISRSPAEIDFAAEYLAQYVNNPKIDIYFELLSNPRPDMPRREVYSQLTDGDKLKRLFKHSTAVRAKGSVYAYAVSRGCRYVDTEEPRPHISHDPNSCAARSLELCSFAEEELAGLESYGTVKHILEGIRSEAESAINRIENPEIAKNVLGFVSSERDALQNGDPDTARRAALAVKTGLKCRYAALGSQEEKCVQEICKCFSALIDMSRKHYDHWQELNALKQRSDELSKAVLLSGTVSFNDRHAMLEKIETLYIAKAASVERAIAGSNMITEEQAKQLIKEIDELDASLTTAAEEYSQDDGDIDMSVLDDLDVPF